MCIAIAKPAGVEIYKHVLETCFEHNSDGAGFATIQDDKILIQKGFFDFDSFWNAYEPFQNEQALIHFRIKTHGNISEENCHPFLINDSLAFIHNGIIPGYGSFSESDTRAFKKKMIIPLIETYGTSVLENLQIKKLLEDHISASKLVFLDAQTRQFTIMNETLGEWNSEVWFSNSSWKKQKVKPLWKPLENNFKKPSTEVWNKHEKSPHEVQYITKYTGDGRYVKIQRDDYLKAISAHAGELTVGKLYIVENCYSNYRVDLYDVEDHTYYSNVSLVALDFLGKEDQTTLQRICYGV